jgi:protein PhnA
MALIDELRSRADYKCELCGSPSRLEVFAVPPGNGAADECVLLCPTCLAQTAPESALDAHHLRCLTEAIWSEVPAVKVVAWRLLSRLAGEEAWARDALENAYLDDETLAWAEASATDGTEGGAGEHKDCHGAVLAAGDTVTLIKDLVVRGANFTAKRGTAVRNISLVPDNPAQIEGRVNGQQIVILTEFVKKAG